MTSCPTSPSSHRSVVSETPRVSSDLYLDPVDSLPTGDPGGSTRFRVPCRGVSPPSRKTSRSLPGWEMFRTGLLYFPAGDRLTPSQEPQTRRILRTPTGETKMSSVYPLDLGPLSVPLPTRAVRDAG